MYYNITVWTVQDYFGTALHRLLLTLLSNTLEVSEKLDIIEKEYNIPVNEELREDVNVMCNLGEGIIRTERHLPSSP